MTDKAPPERIWIAPVALEVGLSTNAIHTEKEDGYDDIEFVRVTSVPDAEIDAIRARVEAATPGPWWANIHAQIFPSTDPNVKGHALAECILDDDAIFIAHSCTDIRRLLTLVDELRIKVGHLKTDLSQARKGCPACGAFLNKETGYCDECHERDAHLEAELATLRAENKRLKSRIQTAKLRLDGGNDCFDSLEEVVESVVQHRGLARARAMEDKDAEV